MYTGVADNAINNLALINSELGTIKKNRMINNNVNDFNSSMNNEQNHLMMQMSDENPDMYNYMLKQNASQESLKPSKMLKILGLLGGI